ncbi:hypothetical protein [Rhodococcoides fascians]|uniref:hypothetical protein n=1 Tax=Rhodococcoides fascians TaxID=1828 RepID=UPI001C91B67D|nr:hypothetical protein [Rhodococcus fascians]MBY4400733.1 hypothetical protein [Rhodococcus fascians]MBY4416280.1 hypothetical protein [Rhodococcus fascians]MDJ0470985.1 hypothetical protein [Rhodococcus fascians]
MAKTQLIKSDYSGDTIATTDALSVKLTLKLGSEAGKSFELDFTQKEYDELLSKLESTTSDEPRPIIDRSKPSKSSPSKSAGSVTSVSDGKAAAWAKFNELLDSEGGTAKALADKINEWLAENPVAKDRGTGNYKSFTATKPGIQPPIIEAYVAAQ